MSYRLHLSSNKKKIVIPPYCIYIFSPSKVVPPAQIMSTSPKNQQMSTPRSLEQDHLEQNPPSLPCVKNSPFKVGDKVSVFYNFYDGQVGSYDRKVAIVSEYCPGYQGWAYYADTSILGYMIYLFTTHILYYYTVSYKYEYIILYYTIYLVIITCCVGFV